MKKVTLAILVGMSMVAGCATGNEVRGTALVGARSSKVFAAGPAVVHAYSLDRGGEFFLAPALTGTDADCAGAQKDAAARRTALKVDQRNVVDVPVGEVACVTADRESPYELMWHAWKSPDGGSSKPNLQLARNR
jgi:hypothetical protein